MKFGCLVILESFFCIRAQIIPLLIGVNGGSEGSEPNHSVSAIGNLRTAWLRFLLLGTPWKFTLKLFLKIRVTTLLQVGTTFQAMRISFNPSSDPPRRPYVDSVLSLSLLSVGFDVKEVIFRLDRRLPSTTASTTASAVLFTTRNFSRFSINPMNCRGIDG